MLWKQVSARLPGCPPGSHAHYPLWERQKRIEKEGEKGGDKERKITENREEENKIG